MTRTDAAVQEVPDSGLTATAAAKHIGVATATLRNWDQRYGLGPSDRPDNSHRRYSRADITRLELMRQLTVEGVAPADAARSALAADVSADVGESAAPQPPSSSKPVLRAIPGGGAGSAVDDVPGPTLRRVTPHQAEVGARIAEIIDAALAYDQSACNDLLTFDLTADPVQWWVEIVAPAWERIAQRTVLGMPGDAPELVLASAALGAMREFPRAYDRAQVAVGNPPIHHPSRLRKLVLIFAPPDEDIPLAAHALAACLVAEGASARVVTGPASPHRAVELVTMVRPSALVLATSLVRPDLGIVAAVHEAFEDLPLLVSMTSDDALGDLPLAPSVQRVRSFTALVHEVLAIVG